MSKDYRILQGDVRDVLGTLPDESVHMVCTSPPYWNLRDYSTGTWEGGEAECDHKGEPKRTQAGFNERYFGKDFDTDKQAELRTPYRDTCGKCGARRVDRQLGLEPTPGEFVQHMVEIFREVRRVLRRDGTLWLNMGDSYAGSGKAHGDDKTLNKGSLAARGINPYNVPQGLKPKDLVGMPWRVAFALQEDGWWLRSAITWAKKSPMPESVTDRPTSATEMIFLLARSEKYYYDADAVREPTAPLTAAAGGYQGRMMRGQPVRSLTSTSIDNADRNDGLRLATEVVTPNPAGRNLWNYLEIEPDEFAEFMEFRAWKAAHASDPNDRWLLGPEPYAQAHFATFPTEIPRRAILAGTSERGVCPACGSPWRRCVEREKVGYQEYKTRPKVGASGKDRDDGGLVMSKGHTGRYETQTTTTGWQPTCTCCQTCDILGLSTEQRRYIHASQGPRARERVAARVEQEAVGEQCRVQGEEARDGAQASEEVRPVWDGLHGQAGNVTVLQPDLLGQVDVGERRGEQVQAGRDGQIHSQESERAQDAGAQIDNGTTLGAGTLAQRGSASPERRQVGQSGRELGGNHTRTTRAAAHDAPPHDLAPYPTQPAVVLDPFAGAGTTLLVALRLGRRAVGIELNPTYIELSHKRILGDPVAMNLNMELVEMEETA